MNSTWIRIGCAVLGAAALAGCQQDRDTDDADVTVTARSRMEADGARGRIVGSDERMGRRAERVARTQFSGADAGDADAVVSSSGETYYGVDLSGGRQVIFDDDGVARTDPIPDVTEADIDDDDDDVDVDVRMQAQ